MHAQGEAALRTTGDKLDAEIVPPASTNLQWGGPRGSLVNQGGGQGTSGHTMVCHIPSLKNRHRYSQNKFLPQKPSQV